MFERLSPAEVENRKDSAILGGIFILSALALNSPIFEALANTIDCAAGYCDPNLMFLPGSATLYSNLDNIDAPRLSPLQRQQIDNLANDYDCSITICGGFVETASGIENRAIAFNLAPGQTIGPVPDWRNTGPPIGKDLDYWTLFGTDLPTPVKDQHKEIFGIPPKDNYNMSNIPYNLFNIPPGSLTFHGNGTATRKYAPWQKPYNWTWAE
jgi:hypothetical protein